MFDQNNKITLGEKDQARGQLITFREKLIESANINPKEYRQR